MTTCTGSTGAASTGNGCGDDASKDAVLTAETARSHAGMPLISICVPTHDGRREVLGELLEGICAQAKTLPGLVEVCVSDNASRDGTAELVAELSRCCPCSLLYGRQQEDVGLARNLLAAVELARGRYCWLLGSDDLLADGALNRVCQLLQELPGATGYVVGATHVDANDPRLRSRALPRAFHPLGDRPRLIEGVDRVLDECGNAWSALSWSVVDRDAWLRSARTQIDSLLGHPVFPQIIVLAAMAMERPIWGWLAQPLVRQRNATTFLFEHREVSLAARWAQIVSAAAAAWGSALGHQGNRRWRRRMRLLSLVWGSAPDVRATKLYGQPPSLRDQGRLAFAWLKAFWPVVSYWREVMPATIMPTWLTRARYGFEHLSAAGAHELDPFRIALSGSLPQRMAAAGVKQVAVEARNTGSRTILAEGPRGVTIAQHWSTDSGRPVGREQLGLNGLASLPQSISRSVRAGAAISAEVTLYAPIQPGRYRVELTPCRHGRAALDQLGEAKGVGGDIEVTDGTRSALRS